MSLPIQLPNLPDPPDEYSREYLRELLNMLTLFFREQNTIGPIGFSAAYASALPDASQLALLPPGTIFEDNGVLKIVRAKDKFFLNPAAAIAHIGTVTTNV